MIRMKALRAFGVRSANEGKIQRGREFMVAYESRARDLESAGLAYRVEAKSEAPPLNKMEPSPLNKAAASGPLASPGGETGAAEPAPSLPPDRQRRKRRSDKPQEEWPL